MHHPPLFGNVFHEIPIPSSWLQWCPPMFASRTQKAYHSTWKRRFIFLDAIIFRGCVCGFFCFVFIFYDFAQGFSTNIWFELPFDFQAENGKSDLVGPCFAEVLKVRQCYCFPETVEKMDLWKMYFLLSMEIL